jgi:hypothetical protein
MNKIIETTNKIKQPAQCCIYCGKSYIKKSSISKHMILCELIFNRNKKTLQIENEEEYDNLPSQKKMYQMLLELGEKYQKMDEKMNEITKWVVKKKKKINVIEWLNTNITPDISFDNLNEKILIYDDDIKYLINNTFNDTINEIFSRTIYNINDNTYPICAFIQKQNVFYIYDNNIWIELSKEKIIKFLNKIHLKISKTFYDWKKKNNNDISENENLSIICDKTLVKLMSVDFKNDTILSKIRNAMYNKIKTDMKVLVEYEFEF